ncbi:EAL domain-containing response regulator [Kamptonema cortianum]|jgi:EAL domain-containing protein (putative c-di-GMP-specific phosphodiesterase class I)/ActR/RegA family two-component response regulator|nr:EAL domain-containing response regulator [Geitlerinema splendidum]MDK3161342.1 EAL domain-containing response regulator [Kamptonema cortianum]
MGGKDRLLIVDDEVEICELLKEVGEQCGYEVTYLSSGAEFYKVVQEINPTFIILDLNIPDHDGIELLRYLAQHNSIATIVLESGQDEKILSISTKLGQDMGLSMEQYFQKPLKLSEIRTLLMKAKGRASRFSIDFLKDAIESKSIVLHYQPKISFKTRKIVGLEALVRLVVDEHLIPPDSFIPLAEETNLIRPLSNLIVQQAFEDFMEFLKIIPELILSINMSPKTFDDLLLPDEFSKLAQKANVNSNQICLEITETAFIEKRTMLADIITRFRIKGFVLSIDDFGTGYASLSELYNLPFNELKIDKSFVLEIESNLEAKAIAQSVILLAHNLGLSVTAEGVETRGAWDVLEQYGCDIAQGFYISKPLEKNILKQWLTEYKKGFILP